MYVYMYVYIYIYIYIYIYEGARRFVIRETLHAAYDRRMLYCSSPLLGSTLQTSKSQHTRKQHKAPLLVRHLRKSTMQTPPCRGSDSDANCEC